MHCPKMQRRQFCRNLLLVLLWSLLLLAGGKQAGCQRQRKSRYPIHALRLHQAHRFVKPDFWFPYPKEKPLCQEAAPIIGAASAKGKL